MIDLRSDTVTRPGPAMRRAIAEAEVGDDVLGDDPTVARLEAMGAEILGKEAALFFPTGTMANQTALQLHTRPGTEAIVEANAHFFDWELGGAAANSGCRYLRNDERQRAYVRDGWNLTGDAYRVDEDGYFWYQARADDMIISGGYNISGPEVENVLLEHPAVLECGVVGVPHDERGMIVKAFIVLKPDVQPGDALVQELQEFVKQQIAPYKYPRAIQFCDALPRTNTGKLQRFKLRELSA